MKKKTKPAVRAQAPAAENRKLFMTLLRDSLRHVAEQMRLDEVAALCGPSHYPPPEATYRRAGTEADTCHAQGRRESILRPRVRRRGADGGEREHVLASYQAIRDPANNAAAVVTALRAGMSTRSQAWASDGLRGSSARRRTRVALWQDPGARRHPRASEAMDEAQRHRRRIQSDPAITGAGILIGRLIHTKISAIVFSTPPS